MPRFAYRAIKIKGFQNPKTRQGFWNGTTSVTGVQNALLFGRLYDMRPIVQSLKHDGLSPEVVDVFLSSSTAQVIPPHSAVVPTFTLKGNVATAGRTAIVRLS